MFGIFDVIGKTLALPVRLVNVPLTVVDRALDGVTHDRGQSTLSAPLNAVAEVIQEEIGELDDQL